MLQAKSICLCHMHIFENWNLTEPADWELIVELHIWTGQRAVLHMENPCGGSNLARDTTPTGTAERDLPRERHESRERMHIWDHLRESQHMGTWSSTGADHRECTQVIDLASDTSATSMPRGGSSQPKMAWDGSPWDWYAKTMTSTIQWATLWPPQQTKSWSKVLKHCVWST